MDVLSFESNEGYIWLTQIPGTEIIVSFSTEIWYLLLV